MMAEPWTGDALADPVVMRYRMLAAWLTEADTSTVDPAALGIDTAHSRQVP